MDKLNAYGSVGTGSLQLAGGMYGNQFNQAGSQMQNPAGLFASIMPYLGPRPNQSASTPGGGRGNGLFDGSSGVVPSQVTRR